MTMVLSILYIEDEADLRDDLVEELGDAGYRVTPAVDGLEALAHLGEGGFDVVLCDVQLPGINGPELLHRAREQLALPLPPFIFLTAYGEDSLRHLGLHIGDARCMVKPVDFDQLIAEIEQAAGRLA